jgi:hypothetical protein
MTESTSDSPAPKSPPELTRGGYSGALDAADLPPPANTPSGTVISQPTSPEPALPPQPEPDPPPDRARG